MKIKQKFKLYQRIRFTDKPFLSDGRIIEVHESVFGSKAYTIKLDKKAPNEYAWDTDEVVSFGDDIEILEE